MTLSFAAVKATENLNAANISSLRFMIIILFCLPILLVRFEIRVCEITLSLRHHYIITVWSFRKVSPFPKKNRLILLLRSLLGSLAITCFFYAVRWLPLGDSIMISHSAMAFTFLQARIFLKEPIVVLHMINIALVLGGLVLVVHPPFIFGYVEDTIRWDRIETSYAYGAAMVAAVFLKPGVQVCLRKLKGTVHTK